MKKNLKRIITLALVVVFVFVLSACGAKKKDGKQTILWLSNLSGGINYEVGCDYLEALCDKLGYEFKVCTGDGFNGAAENLKIVKDNMDDSVVAIVASQDGGILDIMEEYPELYVCGYNCSFDSVYSEDPAVAVNAAVLENDHFLGAIADGYYDGKDIAKEYVDTIIKLGYKNVAFVTFPGFAYPALEVANVEARKLIEEYNKTAAPDAKINVLGEDPATVLMFSPLEESWFIDNAGCNKLDCIVATCAGLQFVYPTMTVAKANGTCAPETHMITGGFDNDPDIIANVGTNKTITHITFAPAEDPLYAMVLIDDALKGALPSDFENIRIASAPYTIETDEDINNVMTKAMAGTGDVTLAQVTPDEVAAMCGKSTHKELIDFMHSEQLSVAWLAKNR